ncbi:hypothetical protein A8C32_05310 [Flavivirga aquatica]|uniref:HNH nuclease domain-containing protein n=1 Tax=Flavivirga aquatica TaxID=1849968 RepID=A0A1E5SHM4_9FLAO|nr:HNH endonuclease signature motif containing protein [Flavivirga aquatica]OEJ98619.1 hypothetical protein A8C32_05310 [Flavivirga aquatica]
MNNNLVIGDRYDGVLLETIKGSSRPRVRPLEYFDQGIRVEFPRRLREENPLGTRFRADVKVSQKTRNGKPFGSPYLVATDSSIVKLDYKPTKSIKAIKLNTASDRAYEYIEKEFKTEPKLIKFSDFREKAYANSIDEPEKTTSLVSSSNRSDIIKTYALSRANGKCESCDNDAPFLKRNGQPYLEVHHIIELSQGGSDSPKNVAAICPNCHARVTHGQDAQEFNNELKDKIENLEAELE